ncbi:bifunctional SGS domain/Nicotinate-nicotinamide nucleotide adenylyltransferase/HSP20-like chaperone/Rossmann-like alpha-beta-alpha sandwich fold/Cytidyltransferase-like domain [Babesia duncani]|uniref:Bifunctional SGS domain/Nicotinate-nicotinamide nucleotide adenylyltransferase/HSP20-like chaperone/Rossmann-like alpha-beta-alpha sandwich fold/Cytidyltransferase-like domain n=1 Tax=Babesia duncani TaxID=323732 RepID=A0AAD9UNQ2_9APIC|nr:bifunctional SGS domain/Nicotinate-nicotinamide nucleotide adenylyltransferase/HSP20-like chaperone/Rossmann-like alpha-beta-alpha sandwich fold/Cytidyltransferase-like domain [Babesia duncani]
MGARNCDDEKFFGQENNTVMKCLLFGGSFDPITMGHVLMLKQAILTGFFNHIWILPSGIRTDKIFKCSSEHRLAMCHSIVDELKNDHPSVAINSYEIDLGTTIDSYFTVKYFQEMYKEYDFYFFLGSDALASLFTWPYIDDLMNITTFVIAERSGYEIFPEHLEKIPHYLLLSDLLKQCGKTFNLSDLSSTIVRNQLKEQESFKMDSSDIPEWEKLLEIATRPTIKAKILDIIQSLSKTNCDLKSTPKLINDATGVTKPILYSHVTSYSWDQTDASLILIIPVGDVVQDVLIEANGTLVDVKIDTMVKRLQLTIRNLYAAVGGDATYKHKRQNLHVTFPKLVKQHWGTLNAPKESPKPKPPKGEDPQNMLMDLMKNMYQEGDADMKRTIAKAWSEAMTKRNDPSGPNFEDFGGL